MTDHACRPDSDTNSSSPNCLNVETTRNNYFTGKFLCTDDFQLEQNYVRSRSQLQNRLLHGWGIACGLNAELKIHCDAHVVEVQPGIAIDNCGREIVLRKCAQLDGIPACLPAGERRLVCIRYVEQKVEPTQAYCGQPETHDDCRTRTSVQEYNRICEQAELVLLDADETEDLIHCHWWPDYERNADTHDQPPAPPPRSAGCVTSSQCCGDSDYKPKTSALSKALVPLALISASRDDCPPQYQSETGNDGGDDCGTPEEYAVEISTCGRNYVGNADRNSLTYISSINWEHGKNYKDMDDLLNDLGDDGSLAVEFSQSILNDRRSFGINECTFEVRYRQLPRGEFQVFPYRKKGRDLCPPNLEGDRRAVYQLDDDLVNSPRPLHCAVVQITLRCDFILDCNGRAVDGNNLGGRVQKNPPPPGSPNPAYASGNGVQGGTFESWFWIGVPGPGEDETC